MDLDKFKAVNDSYGHAVGDKLLQAVAMRLLATLRQSDTASRQGGDEFILLLSGVNGEGSLRRTVEKIQDVVSEPYTIGADTICIGSAIGISVFPDHGEDTQALICCADLAMFRAKQRGSNQYEICTTSKPFIVAPALK